MPIAPNSRVIQAQLRYTWDNQRVMNTLYLLTSLPADLGDVQTFAADLGNWALNNVLPLQSDKVTLREVYAHVMVNGAAIEYTYTGGLPENGTKTNPALPNNVTGAISFRTGLTGRSNRGRNYIIGLCEEDVQDNKLTVTAVSNWTTAYAMLLPFGGALSKGELCVYSQYTDGALRPAGVASVILEALFADDVVDSQRRRLPGRGQ